MFLWLTGQQSTKWLYLHDQPNTLLLTTFPDPITVPTIVSLWGYRRRTHIVHQGRYRSDIGQIFSPVARLIRYLSPNAQLYFVRYAMNWDTIASATAVQRLLEEKRRYRTDIDMSRYFRSQDWYRYRTWKVAPNHPYFSLIEFPTFFKIKILLLFCVCDLTVLSL